MGSDGFQVLKVVEEDGIPSDWNRATVQQLLSDGSLELVQDGNHGGNYPKPDEFADSGIPLITGADINNNVLNLRECKFVKPEKAEKLRIGLARTGDILLSHKGTMGKTAIVPALATPYIVLNPQLTLYRVSENGALDRRYLKYFFGSAHFQTFLNRISAISTISTLSLTAQKSIEIVFPSKPEQQAIAQILASFDDKIELNRRMNATLEAMAQALFKSWFVDFDPVKAKAAGRAPEGMDAATAALFPSEFQDSELGPIPKGWQVGAVKDFADLNNWTLRNSDRLEHIEYIEISAVNKGEVAEVVTYERGSEPSRARRRLRHGDTVLSTVRPEREAYFLCLHPSDSLIASTGFAVISPRDANWAFLHAALSRAEIFETLGNLADGGAYPAVRPEMIGNLELLVPAERQIIELFHQSVAPLYERANANRIESRSLAEIRDALLPKIISGQLRIPDAGAVAEAAL